MQGEIITINTDAGVPPQTSDSLIEGRRNISTLLNYFHPAKATIVIQAYNRLEKTRACVGSVLRYTGDVDYELLLIDNGSTDGTLDYFKELPYPHKRIMHLTKNLGAALPGLLLSIDELAPYIAILGNDIVVTQNWLSNILRGMEADERTGMVCAVSSNTSNLQQVNLPFSDPDEMQRQAAAFNQPDLSKWQERLRLVTTLTVFRRECLLAIGLPWGDVGFFHDFADDDIAFRVRRMGYRTMLAGDTWVHHNHDYSTGEDKNPEEFRQSLQIGQENFREKYHGVDAWEDVNNFWMDITPHIPEPKCKERKAILGVDTKCGTPILDVKNRLRNFGIFDVELSAFTQSAKYVVDLNTICEGIVACDREEFLGDQFLPEYFDYIVVDCPINRYHEPQKVINDLARLLKPGGLLLLPLLNTFSFREYLYCQGRHDLYSREFAYHIPPEALQSALTAFGAIKFCYPRYARLNQDDQKFLLSRLPQGLAEQQQMEALRNLMIERFIFCVRKEHSR